MSRRDTIIIAVLINAGLLIVLFATALKSNPPESEITISTSPATPSVAELPIKKDNPVVQGDEVDQVLSQYSNAAPLNPPPAPVNQLSTPIAAVTPAMPSSEVKSSFTDDLKAITQPVTQAPAPLPAAPLVEKAASKQGHQVTVRKGDVLEKIARSNRTTVEEIMRINHLTSTRLKIGQVLRMPSSSDKKTSVVSNVTPTAQSDDQSPKYYTVKNGDNPWTIAVKNHMKVEDLLKLNNLNEEKARRLKAGDQLRIR